MKALGEFLRPEFINRVDEIVCFNQLSEDNFRGIADIMLAELQQSLEGRFFALQLRDETTVRREIWDKCGEDTLRGLFLQELRREYDGGDEETRRRIELAARFGVAAMDNREV